MKTPHPFQGSNDTSSGSRSAVSAFDAGTTGLTNFTRFVIAHRVWFRFGRPRAKSTTPRPVLAGLARTMRYSLPIKPWLSAGRPETKALARYDPKTGQTQRTKKGPNIRVGFRGHREATELSCVCDEPPAGSVPGHGGVGGCAAARKNARRTIVSWAAFALAIIRSLGADIDVSLLNRYVDAIYIAEGGPKTKYPYGIKSIKVSGIAEAKRVCQNTVRNNHRRWVAAGSPGEFTVFLARRYCPPSVDPAGHTNWIYNINKILKNDTH